jgi:hypothetical protein
LTEIAARTPQACLARTATLTIRTRRRSAQEGAAFDDNTTAAIVEAFEDACQALRVIDKPGRGVIAARVFDLALAGLVDAKALRDRIIQESRTDV